MSSLVYIEKTEGGWGTEITSGIKPNQVFLFPKVL